MKTFDMNSGIHKQITIWKCYHDESQIKKYNLFENERIFLFNSTDTSYEGNNLNHLNKFFCEGVCLLYPYLNNLKSEIIGFQHYRRWFHSSLKDLKIDRIKNGEIQYFEYRGPKIMTTPERIFDHNNFWRVIGCGYHKDMTDFLKEEYPEIYNYPKTDHNMIGFDIFVMNWQEYTKYAKFLLDYINFVANRYNLKMVEEDWKKHIEDTFIKYNREYHIAPHKMPWGDCFGQKNWYTDPYESPDHFKWGLYRIYSFLIEFLTSLWINTHKGFLDPNNKLIKL